VNYEDALAYILSFSDYERSIGGTWPATRFSLARIEALCALLGRPQDDYPVLQVAGTKGKGSTAAMLQAALGAGGWRTGLFTSPHLHDLRERIRLGPALIPPATLAELVAELQPAIARLNERVAELGAVTTFEILTALALLYFSHARADVAVLEVGLGGRLDATSVAHPRVAVITAISLDHRHILGNTIAEIAREKAGIVKEGALVVSSPQVPEAAEVLVATCRERGATLLLGGRDWQWREQDGPPDRRTLAVASLYGELAGLRPALLGRHQLVNAATAVVALQALKERDGPAVDANAIAAGLSSVVWPGRFEVVPGRPTVVVDGAHNDDSARRLREALAEQFPGRRLILVIGTSADKDLPAIVRELAPAAARVICTRSRHPRSAPADLLVSLCREEGVAAEEAADVPAALARARLLAHPTDVVCATGSLFVVAEAREALGLPRLG
jgi:dihydrofolate synthase / folylpolyglutamate synthase